MSYVYKLENQIGPLGLLPPNTSIFRDALNNAELLHHVTPPAIVATKEPGEGGSSNAHSSATVPHRVGVWKVQTTAAQGTMIYIRNGTEQGGDILASAPVQAGGGAELGYYTLHGQAHETMTFWSPSAGVAIAAYRGGNWDDARYDDLFWHIEAAKWWDGVSQRNTPSAVLDRVLDNAHLAKTTRPMILLSGQISEQLTGQPTAVSRAWTFTIPEIPETISHIAAGVAIQAGPAQAPLVTAALPAVTIKVNGRTVAQGEEIPRPRGAVTIEISAAMGSRRRGQINGFTVWGVDRSPRREKIVDPAPARIAVLRKVIRATDELMIGWQGGGSRIAMGYYVKGSTTSTGSVPLFFPPFVERLRVTLRGKGDCQVSLGGSSEARGGLWEHTEIIERPEGGAISEGAWSMGSWTAIAGLITIVLDEIIITPARYLGG